MRWFGLTLAKIVSCTLAAAVVATPTLAQTTVGGFIDSDTLWSAADGPFIVDQSILVTNNATLAIEPGTQVRFAPNRGLVVSSGQLIARGTETDKIHFRADADFDGEISDDDRWGFIAFADDAVDAMFDANTDEYIGGSILEHTIVEHAGSTGDAAVSINEAAPFINRSWIRDNRNVGINASLAHGIRVTENTMTRNATGLEINDADDARVTHNTITSNRTGAGFNVLNNATVSFNTISENTSIGAFLEDPVNSVISNNLFLDNEGEGIVISGSRNSRFDDNMISGNFASGGGSSDGALVLDFSGGDRMTLSGNRIVDNLSNGVRVNRNFGELILSDDPLNPTMIFSNAGVQILNDAPFDLGENPEDDGNVDASNVFWNTINPDTIAEGIVDFFDDVSRGIVFFEPFFEPLPGDANLDGTVGFVDFIHFQGHFGQDGGWIDGDFNGDGTVGFIDFLILQGNFEGSSDEAAVLAQFAAVVPEPSALLCLSLLVPLVPAVSRLRSHPQT